MEDTSASLNARTEVRNPSNTSSKDAKEHPKRNVSRLVSYIMEDVKVELRVSMQDDSRTHVGPRESVAGRRDGVVAWPMGVVGVVGVGGSSSVPGRVESDGAGYSAEDLLHCK